MIGVGIVGTGVGIRTYLPVLRRIAGVEVVAVAGSSLERAQYFAKQESIPRAMPTCAAMSALPDIDLVCVASPNPYHRDQVLAALACKKHVLCEKPLGMSLAECDELTNSSKQHPELLALINHQLRFNPYIAFVKNVLATGGIGRPYFVRIHQQSVAFANRQAPWSWSFDVDTGGGVRLAMGSHLVDLVRFWFPAEVTSVRGTMDAVIRSRVFAGEERPIHVSGFFAGNLSLADGVEVQMSATSASCGSPRFDFSIFGEEGEVHFDLDGKLRGAFLSERGVVRQIEVPGVTPEELANRVSIFSGSFVYFAPRIVQAIEQRQPIAEAASFADARPVLRVLESIRESSISGETIVFTQKHPTNATS